MITVSLAFLKSCFVESVTCDFVPLWHWLLCLSVVCSWPLLFVFVVFSVLCTFYTHLNSCRSCSACCETFHSSTFQWTWRIGNNHRVHETNSESHRFSLWKMTLTVVVHVRKVFVLLHFHSHEELVTITHYHCTDNDYISCTSIVHHYRQLQLTFIDAII